MRQEDNQNGLFIFILIILALEAILFSVGNTKLEEAYRRDMVREKEKIVVLDNIPVLAKAVSVYNIDKNKKVYGRNDEVPLPIASLSKIMTAVMALNSYRADDILTISPNAINQTGDYGLLVGEEWGIHDVAKLTLVSSANDGAYALAENDATFLEKMNIKARKIGMDHVLFSNVTGLDVDLLIPGAFASASDVNTMAMYGWKSHTDIFSSTALAEINLASVSGFMHNFKNTNPIVDKIPNLLFSKTGFTEVAGGNLTVIFKNKKDESLIITVLGSTFDGRFSDMEKLVNVLYNL